MNIKNQLFCNVEDPLKQLKLASKSKIFILSNSSFAWWAYFLSNHKNKIIFKPNKWWIKGIGNPGFLKSDEVISIDC